MLWAFSDVSFVFLAYLATFSPDVSLPNTEHTVNSYEDIDVICTYVCYDKFSRSSQATTVAHILMVTIRIYSTINVDKNTIASIHT